MQLNYKTYGEGEVLIILHGLFGMLDNWATLGRRFGQDYKVYIVDQRNHGKSPHDPEMNYKIMAEDLNGFMQEHQIDKATICGHSMGGKTAMQFASDYPEKVERLIVADIAPRAYEHGHTEVFDAFYNLDLSQIKSRSDADRLMTPLLADFGTRQFILKNLARNKEGGYDWRPALDYIRDAYPNIIDQVDAGGDMPTLFIKGGKSSYIEKEEQDSIEDLYTELRFKEMTNAGHWVHAEQPEEFYNLIIDFIETTS